MQTLLTVLIVLLAMAYLLWQWWPRTAARHAEPPGGKDACRACNSCVGCHP